MSKYTKSLNVPIIADAPSLAKEVNLSIGSTAVASKIASVRVAESPELTVFKDSTFDFTSPSGPMYLGY